MSWLVETLILSRFDIRSEDDANIFSDSYDDLLVLEKKINDLHQQGLLDKIEVDIINAVSESGTFNSVAREMNINPQTIAKYFHSTCEKIAFHLGGMFTDFGYMKYMKEKYNLTDEQVEKMEEFMNSIYKHKIMKVKEEH